MLFSDLPDSFWSMVCPIDDWSDCLGGGREEGHGVCARGGVGGSSGARMVLVLGSLGKVWWDGLC